MFRISIKEIEIYKKEYLEFKKSNYNFMATIQNANNYTNILISFCKNVGVDYVNVIIIYDYILNLEKKHKSLKDKYFKIK